jgi:DNA-binding XRE family transcriptional regulator
MATYQIYALVDPRDQTIRYIGVSKDVQTRLAQHMREVQNEKRKWLSELYQQGLVPDIKILETIEAEQDADIIYSQRELHWIRYFSQAGAPLTNISGLPRALAQRRRSRPSARLSSQSHLTKFGELRIKANLSSTQLAKEANISLATIAKLEKGQPVRAPLASRACRVLSRHLGVELNIWDLKIPIIR